jgi:hypothetical protein
LGPLDEIFERYGDRVAFALVYIREAHPEDGWVVKMNREQGIAVRDPVTDEERRDVAKDCALRMKVRMPVLVDPIDDRTARAYGALPTRLYLVGKGGQITYQQPAGPWHLKPPELKQAIEAELERIA